MGQKDLGTCLILSSEDIKFLGLTNFPQIEQIGSEYQTPSIPFFLYTRKVNKKLRNYIEKVARKQNADLALITHQGDSRGFIDEREYSFKLYRYQH